MKHTKKSVLIVALDFPYPANHGGRLDIWGRIIVLAQLGFKIDLVVTVKETISSGDIEVVKQYVDNIYLCKRENRIIDVFSPQPLQLRSRRSLQEITLDNDYDIALLETQYVLPIMKNHTLRAKDYIIRLQNDETIYFQELASSARILWKKVYYLLESYKFKLLEPKIFQRFENIVFISQDEMNIYINRYSKINSIFLPPPISGKYFKQSLASRNVLFIGSLFMTNNQEAIKWYINEIHQLLIDIEEYQLIIVGNSRGECLDWLYELVKNEKNIHIYDSPKTLAEFYEESCVFVNPMLHGAGVKLKTIEAITNGLPVVSTTVGNQGTGLVDKEHILIADDPKLYAKYIREFILDSKKGRDIVTNGQKYLSEHYDQKKLLNNYLSALMEG